MFKCFSVALALVLASAGAFAGELNVQGGSSTGGMPPQLSGAVVSCCGSR